jgi:hypothetical protein
MGYVIEYQQKGAYDTLLSGITIEAILRYGNIETSCPAKIDTGSHVCLFERGIADYLGIEVEKGYRQRFATLAGGVVAYAHELELETLGIRMQSYIYFAESYAIRRNLLGQQGWLQFVQLGVHDYAGEIYLSPNQ